MRRTLTSRAYRWGLSLTAAALATAAVVLGIATSFHSPQDEQSTSAASQTHDGDSFVAKKWGERPAK